MRVADPKPIPELLALWQKMIPGARIEFAKLARTTSGNLRQYAEGRRGISSTLAIRIEKATIKLGFKPISRMKLNATCRECEFARRCHGLKEKV